MISLDLKPDTVHSLFMEHMLLAMRWRERQGFKHSEVLTVRAMQKHDAETLRRLIAALDARSAS